MEDHRPPMMHEEDGMGPHDEFREPDGKPMPFDDFTETRDSVGAFNHHGETENEAEPFNDFEEPPLPFDDEFGDGPKPDRKPLRGPQFEDHPPLILGQHDLVATIILILMLGINLGIKLYYRQRGDRERLTELEKQNLAQQLEYLKYQINPHFLMNTLNNIHALVDIDAERAKESIVELSKIMRFVLYEGSQPTVPLNRELAFTQDYIRLMRMRVTDRVKINVEIPEAPANSQLPPMVLITFVENAFKHGVSYRQPSFIDIKITINDDKLLFTCRNSKIPQTEDQHGGVGLQNVRQRLDLIYGKKYTLTIDDTPSEYNISLVLPL
ncbi:MAG: histidine kinase [Prevotella sp.]|nr:histidine kinase [Prevotella sp.]